MNNTQILWGSSKIIVIDHTPQRKVDMALQFVAECLNGDRGFCYSLVKHYPLDSGRELRETVVKLQRERMSPATCKGRGDVITTRLAEYKVAEREHYQYDIAAYKTLKSNYDKLKRSLELLYANGEVESYTLFKDGRLKVNYFTSWKAIEIKKIGNSWTFTHEHDPYHNRRKQKLRERVFDLFKMDVPQEPTGFVPLNVTTATHMNNTGFKTKPHIGKTIGNGEHNPKGQHYNHNIVWTKNGTDITLEKEVLEPLFDRK